jgi:uncharacterized protein
MFLGRKRELGLLDQIISSSRAKIGVIYGRRRIGKSELIKKSLEKKQALSFEGLENRPKQEQIDSFLFQLAYQSKYKVKSQKTKSWREAFIYLYEELQLRPCHIVFDEFQWMANYRSEIISDLKMVWDQYISTIPGVTLILCGSIASFMTTKVIKSNALYGRTDLEIHLKGFLLPETKKMLKGKGFQEIIEAQMILGGVPKYLDLIREFNSIRLGIENLTFTETGYLVDEYSRIFLSHFGRNKDYERIIAILSAHPYGLFRKDISKKTGLDLGGGLTTHLRNLESAGFISSTTPFHKEENSRLLKYHLSDSYLRFYFSFIKPNLKKIKSGIYQNLFGTISQSASFYTWMGCAFEYLCLEHAGKLSKILGFSGVDFSFGPYFSAARKNEPGVQIDLLFSRADNVITLCEMKYTIAPIGISIIKEVERKAAILRDKFKRKTIQKVLVSLSSPSKELVNSGYFFRIIHPEELL